MPAGLLKEQDTGFTSEVFQYRSPSSPWTNQGSGHLISAQTPAVRGLLHQRL